MMFQFCNGFEEEEATSFRTTIVSEVDPVAISQGTFNLHPSEQLKFGDPKHEILNRCSKFQKGEGVTSQTILGPNQPYINVTDPMLT